MSSFSITYNFGLLEEIKTQALAGDGVESLAGVDFIISKNVDKNKVKIKCMLCLASVSNIGVYRHISSSLHKSSFIKLCFPSTFSYLKELEMKTKDSDETLKLMCESLLKAFTSKICVDIVRKYPEKFIPWQVNDITEKDFNSSTLVLHVRDKIIHVNEKDFPSTKDIINNSIENFMQKSKELMAIVGFGKDEKNKDENYSIANPRKRLRLNSQSMNKPSISQLDYEQMEVAVKIAHEIFSKGLSISAFQLEASVKSYYRLEFEKSPDEVKALDELTLGDVKYLVKYYEELLEPEQYALKSYLVMLKRVDHETFKEIQSDKNCSEILKKIIK